MNINEKLEEGWLHTRVILEIIGSPREHVEVSMQKVIANIKGEKYLEVVNERIEEVNKQETGHEETGLHKELWATFAELEIMLPNNAAVIGFCFAYMPSSIEVLAPTEIVHKSNEESSFFNDLCFRLHEVNKVTTELRSQYNYNIRNFHNLFTNFILILIGNNERTFEELHRATGTNEKSLQAMLDTLVEKEKVTKNDGKYKLAKQG